MKRVVCIIMCLLLCSICLNVLAEKSEQITFHSIPWLSNETAASQLLEDYLDLGFTVSKTTDGLFIAEDGELYGRPVTTREYSDRCICLSLAGTAEGKIAGYPIKNILLTFTFDGVNSKLVCVKADLAGADYKDLSSKLTKVYGEGKSGIDEEGLMTMLWEGADNSCVLLYSIDGGETADLIYGRLDAQDLFEDIELTDVDPDDLSGL